MKATNLYCNRKLMAMATNLYYHCWFARVRLQEIHLFELLLMLLFLFISLFPFLMLMSSFSTAPHTHNSTHTNTKTKERKKKQNQKKNKEITKTLIKDTRLKEKRSKSSLLYDCKVCNNSIFGSSYNKYLAYRSFVMENSIYLMF